MIEAIRERAQQIQVEISVAAKRAGRDPNDIKILAATKTRNVAEIMAAVHAGIRLIGENTVQEALGKFEFLPPQLEKHMIGTLQPNKAKAAVRLFDCIQSVTSIELAVMIDTEAGRLNKKLPVLIEVNPAGEASKQGIPLSDVDRLAGEIGKLRNAQLRGLMAMLPHADNPESLRPLFDQVRQTFERIGAQLDAEWDTLSMGMSDDYTIAVEEGSTLVRLGTALFGQRDR